MSAKDKYEEFYSDLVKKLPMKDPMFLADLTSAGLFATGNLKDEVKARSTPADKATHFLDEAITPFMEEDDIDLEPLYKLLKVMEKHGGVVKRLADKIKAAIPNDGGSGGASSGATSMYNNKIIYFNAVRRNKVFYVRDNKVYWGA